MTYCNNCGNEVRADGSTWYKGKQWCQCKQYCDLCGAIDHNESDHKTVRRKGPNDRRRKNDRS